MLKKVCPKLPMRNKPVTKDFYINQLGFKSVGNIDYPDYLMVTKDEIEIHFLLFKDLNPKENYGQVYLRVSEIEKEFERVEAKGVIYKTLESKLWGQKEFSVLDPDNNLLTFGEPA
ncbi:MAG: VOC family protein [Cyclobacteriaceae bacterium]|nr:VOC family protein [Cyclobacteriaceae bacterium]